MQNALLQNLNIKEKRQIAGKCNNLDIQSNVKEPKRKYVKRIVEVVEEPVEMIMENTSVSSRTRNSTKVKENVKQKKQNKDKPPKNKMDSHHTNNITTYNCNVSVTTSPIPPIYYGLSEIKQNGIQWVENTLKGDFTYTKPGSISHLLYGEKPSEQSINIKLGRLGEYISKELIKSNTNLELLICGIQNINNKKKDVDLIFKDETKKIIYYRELKGNIELDTEKLPATIAKCKEIENDLKTQYISYTIDCGILNWSVYNRKILTAGLSNIKTFENGGIKIYHMEDFLRITNIVWNETDYYNYFREIGNRIRVMFDKCNT